MGHPEKSCRKCGWYIRGNAYNGPQGYGGCFKKGKPTHANQQACEKDFDSGQPSMSLLDAQLKSDVAELQAKLDKAVGVVEDSGRSHKADDCVYGSLCPWCETDSIESRLRKANVDIETLSQFAKNATRWREHCRDHDDERGYERRDFADDEEWAILENAAMGVLRKVE